MRRAANGGSYRWGPAAVLIVVLGAAAYAPGLHGPFVLDDYTNFVLNPYAALTEIGPAALRDAVLANESTPLKRPLAALTFALNHYFAGGFDPFPFKVTNLAIHLANGLLVYALLMAIQQRFVVRGVGAGSRPAAGLPLAAAALWTVHPIQLTSVLYVVQRMNSLSALFVLAGLLLFVSGRGRLADGRPGALPRMYGGVASAVLLGLTAKENAVLAPILAAVLEIAVFERRALDAARLRTLKIFFFVVLGAPACAALAVLAFHPEIVLDGYVRRPWGPIERLLSESRILLGYVGLTLLPLRGGYGLARDDVEVSTGLLTPWTTGGSILAWVALVAVAWRWRSREPAVLLAVAWFLAGHLVESTVLGLELVHEHRNYLPSIGIVFAMVHYLDRALLRFDLPPRAVLATVGGVVLVFGVVTNARSVAWSSLGRLVESQVRNHPDSPRAHAMYAEYVINGGGSDVEAFAHLKDMSRLDRYDIAGLGLIVRMAGTRRERIASRIGEGELPDPDGPQDPPSDALFTLPLNDDPRTLARLERLAGEAISARLRDGPMVIGNLKALIDLQGCLYDGVPVCRRLAVRIERWFDLALANPRVMPHERALLWLHAGRVKTFLGKPVEAVRHARAAIEADPGNIHYPIELARLHLSNGETAEAHRVVEAIRARFGAGAVFRGGEVAELEAALIDARHPGN